MARTSSDDVLEIITTTLTDIDTFVNTANLFVTNHLGSSSLDDTTLKEIERYVAAHFVAMTDTRVKSEKVDVLGTTFVTTVGMGLEASVYGQQAIILDSTGTLASIAKNGPKQGASIGIIEYLE